MHYIHVGYVGIVGNAHYTQMADFVLGLFGLDIAGDDGRRLGLWPWESETEREPSPAAEFFHEKIFGLD